MSLTFTMAAVGRSWRLSSPRLLLSAAAAVLLDSFLDMLLGNMEGDLTAEGKNLTMLITLWMAPEMVVDAAFDRLLVRNCGVAGSLHGFLDGEQEL